MGAVEGEAGGGGEEVYLESGVRSNFYKFVDLAEKSQVRAEMFNGGLADKEVSLIRDMGENVGAIGAEKMKVREIFF